MPALYRLSFSSSEERVFELGFGIGLVVWAGVAAAGRRQLVWVFRYRGRRSRIGGSDLALMAHLGLFLWRPFQLLSVLPLRPFELLLLPYRTEPAHRRVWRLTLCTGNVWRRR